MLKNIIKMEFEIAGKVYHLLCDNDSPISHVKEALCQFLKFAGQIEDQIKASQEKSAAAPEVNQQVEAPKEV